MGSESDHPARKSDYELESAARYPDPANLLPNSAEGQIFVHTDAVSEIGWF